MYACTPRIAGKRVDERLATQNVSAWTQERGKLGVVSGMLHPRPCAVCKGAIREWAGPGRHQSFCAGSISPA
jgi:hypothetical protein